jgi:adenylyltransferase/sulfurtransferase
MELNSDELRRYARHTILPEIGLEGQKKIRATSVLCIGAGGLGSPIALYLAAAGIGKLGLVDFDSVERVGNDLLITAYPGKHQYGNTGN